MDLRLREWMTLQRPALQQHEEYEETVCTARARGHSPLAGPEEAENPSNRPAPARSARAAPVHPLYTGVYVVDGRGVVL